jgi:hypothetical protein
MTANEIEKLIGISRVNIHRWIRTYYGTDNWRIKIIFLLSVVNAKDFENLISDIEFFGIEELMYFHPVKRTNDELKECKKRLGRYRALHKYYFLKHLNKESSKN